MFGLSSCKEMNRHVFIPISCVVLYVYGVDSKYIYMPCFFSRAILCRVCFLPIHAVAFYTYSSSIDIAPLTSDTYIK